MRLIRRLQKFTVDKYVLCDKIVKEFNISLSRAAEGTGPVMPGNLILYQGANSGGLSER